MGNLLNIRQVAERCGMFEEIIQKTSGFPEPCKQTNDGPLWDEESVDAYMSDFYIFSSKDFYGPLKASVLGRSRSGKSFLVSRLVESRDNYMDLFCKDGEGGTFCTVKNIIATTRAFDYIEFRVEYDEKKIDSNLLKRIKDITRKVPINQIDFARTKLQEFRELSQAIGDAAKTYITVYLRPNEYTSNLLKDAKKGELIFIDTPGVSCKVKIEGIEKSDMYIIVLKNDNLDEADSLRDIAAELKKYATTSKVTFLYHVEKVLRNEEQYAKAEDIARGSIKPFEDKFASLRECIVDTGLDLLYPEKNCLLFPTMEDDVTFVEEIFLGKIKERFVSAAIYGVDAELKMRFDDVVKHMPEEAHKLALELISGIPNHDIKDGNYTKKTFSSDDHMRTKTEDDCRVVNALWIAYLKETNKVYGLFSKYKLYKYEDWQETVIKYVYQMLAKTVESDFGLGHSNHWREDNPPATMRVEESIFAREILEAFSKNPNEYMRVNYINALCNQGIDGIWKNVYCYDTKYATDALKKLKIIRDVIGDVSATDESDLILRTHVCGLRKYAEYAILKSLGMSEEEAMKTIKELPF